MEKERWGISSLSWIAPIKNQTVMQSIANSTKINTLSDRQQKKNKKKMLSGCLSLQALWIWGAKTQNMKTHFVNEDDLLEF